MLTIRCYAWLGASGPSSGRQYAFNSVGTGHEWTEENAGESSGAAQLALLEELESEVKTACSELVAPLFGSMRAALEAKILAVHKQKFGETARGVLASEIQGMMSTVCVLDGIAAIKWLSCVGVACCVVLRAATGSEYMSEFAKHAGMIAKLLSRYDAANPIIKAHTVELVNRLVTYATRHLSLVGTYRSIPEEHLHLLATDVAQFTVSETAFSVSPQASASIQVLCRII